MKHLITILAAVVIIVGLVGAGLNIYYAISNNQDYISKADYRGHSYVLVHADGSTGITHDPDCPCWEKEGTMRQIKFRGKLINSDEWLYGGYYQASTGENRIITVDETTGTITDWNVQPDTVGQFTGLLDKNGKEIYEGDIITVNGQYPRVVLWDKMCWALMPTEYYHDKMFWVMNLQHPRPDWWELFSNGFEVIGNIHDNPELLNEK